MPSGLSQQCQDIMKNILKKNAEERLSLDQILNHPWITRGKTENKKKDDKTWMQALKN